LWSLLFLERAALKGCGGRKGEVSEGCNGGSKGEILFLRSIYSSGANAPRLFPQFRKLDLSLLRKHLELTIKGKSTYEGKNEREEKRLIRAKAERGGKHPPAPPPSSPSPHPTPHTSSPPPPLSSKGTCTFRSRKSSTAEG